MEITFISSLDPEDERRLASALMSTVGSMLDLLPIAYSIRIRTASGKILNRTHSPSDPQGADSVPLAKAIMRRSGPNHSASM